ncbi:MAG TPA: DUF805 domain-containing protein [Pseudolabrys sp.]|jgi:uncharacterized membrane protein YhaH (DUF805 family)|nr:DUF805 domain-containing protein [Pseudolabrys sp.]
MQFQDAIRSGFRNYVTFAGRASRSEYWFWVLFALLVEMAASIIDHSMFAFASTGPIEDLTSLILFLPGFAVSFRRLHDIDRTGWWWLIALTGIGIIVLLIWACTRGTAGANRYGADPLSGAAVTPPVSA